MATGTLEAVRLQLAAQEPELRRRGVRHLAVFGSVARGEATSGSDIDLLVDLSPGGGNELLRVSGIAEELTALLGAPLLIRIARRAA